MTDITTPPLRRLEPGTPFKHPELGGIELRAWYDDDADTLETSTLNQRSYALRGSQLLRQITKHDHRSRMLQLELFTQWECSRRWGDNKQTNDLNKMIGSLIENNRAGCVAKCLVIAYHCQTDQRLLKWIRADSPNVLTIADAITNEFVMDGHRLLDFLYNLVDKKLTSKLIKQMFRALGMRTNAKRWRVDDEKEEENSNHTYSPQMEALLDRIKDYLAADHFTEWKGVVRAATEAQRSAIEAVMQLVVEQRTQSQFTNEQMAATEEQAREEPSTKRQATKRRCDRVLFA